MNKQSTQQSSREKKFNIVSQNQGLAIAVLFLGSIIMSTYNEVTGSVLAVAAVLTIIGVFVSGYKRSDEFEQAIQLKAASISFVIMMIALSIVSMLEAYNVTPEAVSTYMLYLGFLTHLIVLPNVRKRIDEK